MAGSIDLNPDDPIPVVHDNHKKQTMPTTFTDSHWATSNCGNPTLKLFGFGPVAAGGYGIGYGIKEGGKLHLLLALDAYGRTYVVVPRQCISRQAC